MALNRFYQQGQSQYVSQYVPHKLPFELWQQGLLQRDTEVDQAILDKSNMIANPIGLKELGIAESNRSYYDDTDAALNQEFKTQAVSDYDNSLKAVNQFNQKVSELTKDDIINQVASGDLADSMIGLQKEYNTINSQNSVYQARLEWKKKADEEIAKHANDIQMSPYLQTGYKIELQKMLDDPTYVPTAPPAIGKSMDRSSELISILNSKKASGFTKEDLQPNERYTKTTSGSGVSANEYELFTRNLLDNTNSNIRKDIEAQVDAHINEYNATDGRSGLNPEFREQAIQAEIDQLVEVGKNLKYKTTSTTYEGKSDSQIDFEKGQIMYPKDAAVDEVINGTSVSLNKLGTTSTASRERYDKLETEIKSKLPTAFLEAVGGINGMLNLTKEELDSYARQYKIGIPTYQLMQINSQLSEAKWETENLENQYKINDSNIRAGSGFTTNNEGTYNLLSNLKKNPTQYINMYTEALNNPNSPFRNTPEFKEMEYIKSGNPELYNDLVGLATGESNILSLYSINDFKTNNGTFDPEKAKNFLTNVGVELPQSVINGSPLTEFEFNKILKTNSKGDTLYNVNQDLTNAKVKYDNLANTNVTVTQDRLLTLPGMTSSYSTEDLQFMKQFVDPLSSSLTVGNQVSNDPYVAFALSETLMNSKTPVVMTMTSAGNYIYEGTASNNILQNPENMMYFRDAYVRKQTGGAIDTYEELGEEERKQIDESLKTYLGGTSPIHFEIAATKSTAFTNYNLSKVENYNKTLDGSDPNFLNSVYAENVILNKDNIERAEKLNQTAGFVSYGDDVKAFGYAPVQTNIQFQIKDYNGGDGSVNSHNIVLKTIAPSQVEESQYVYSQTTSNVNGQPNTWEADMTSGTEMQIVDGKPIYNYYFTDTSGNLLNGGEPIPATSVSEALNQISNSVNAVQQ